MSSRGGRHGTDHIADHAAAARRRLQLLWQLHRSELRVLRKLQVGPGQGGQAVPLAGTFPPIRKFCAAEVAQLD